MNDSNKFQIQISFFPLNNYIYSEIICFKEVISCDLFSRVGGSNINLLNHSFYFLLTFFFLLTLQRLHSIIRGIQILIFQIKKEFLSRIFNQLIN